MQTSEICRNCGASLTAGGAFCPQCGRTRNGPIGARRFILIPVLAVAALSAGAFVWMKASALPNCGDPIVTAKVLDLFLEKIPMSDRQTQDRIRNELSPSIDLVEKGALDSDGLVRTCAAHLTIPRTPEIVALRFSALEPSSAPSGATLRVGVDYEVRKLDGTDSEVLVSLNNSEALQALQRSLAFFSLTTPVQGVRAPTSEEPGVAAATGTGPVPISAWLGQWQSGKVTLTLETLDDDQRNVRATLPCLTGPLTIPAASFTTPSVSIRISDTEPVCELAFGLQQDSKNLQVSETGDCQRFKVEGCSLHLTYSRIQ